MILDFIAGQNKLDFSKVSRNSGIYAIINLINGKFYIGSAKNFYERYHAHKSYLKSNSHHNEHLQRAWNKYGEENFIFVILEETSDVVDREQFWIDITDATLKGYNIRSIANSALGVKRTAETRAKMSAWQFGNRVSEETKAKISETLTGRILSDDHKFNIAAGHRKIEKWPCISGYKCSCDKCKLTRSNQDAIYRQNRKK